MEIFKTYIVTFVVFFAIDIIWLGFIAKDMYRNNIGHLMADTTNWPAAIIFYLFFIGGLVFFVVNPSLEKESWTQALMWGGFFGFICYATYDMTNLATLRDWPLKMTIIDITWGSILNALTSAVSYFIVRLIT